MLNLTQEEQKVIIFLTSIVLLGIGTSYTIKMFTPLKAIARLEDDLGKIDLNSADKNSLERIPGIGDKLAQRIIEARGEVTGFSDIEQLKSIKGITNNKFNKIKNYLLVR